MTNTIQAIYSKAMVMKSAAGYYVGTGYSDPEIGVYEPGLPNSRESDYFASFADAHKYLHGMYEEDEIEVEYANLFYSEPEEEDTMNTYADMVKETATSNQYAQIIKAVGDIATLNKLVDTHSEDLASIKGIGPKLVEVLCEATIEYHELISKYPAEDTEEEYLSPKLDNALQVALENIKPLREAKIFTIDPELVMDTPQSVPSGTEEAMAGITKALRGCAPKRVEDEASTRVDVLTRECVLMIEGGFYRVHKGEWTQDYTLATSTVETDLVKDRMRAMRASGYAGMISLYVVKCVNGVIVDRAPEPWMKWNAATGKSVKHLRTPAFGVVTK